MIKMNALPENTHVRVPTMDDLQAVFELINACDIVDEGMPDHTLDDLRIYWQSPDFNLASDAWLVETSEGKPVGYADTDHEGHGKVFSFVRVLPAYREQGIERHLLHLVEARAMQRVAEAPANIRVALYSWLSRVDKTLARALEHEGFKLARTYWRMEMNMQAVPQAPQWSGGITVRTFIAGQEDQAVFAMVEEAFQDHWGHTPATFEQWARWTLKREGFDPTLWFLAFAGEKLVGGALCLYNEDLDLGWLDQLAVLRPWRRQGLGMALLQHFMSEFYRRGVRKVGLGVDSQNLTGATRLYERAGMHVALQHDTYEKELRAGKDLRTQSISV